MTTELASYRTHISTARPFGASLLQQLRARISEWRRRMRERCELANLSEHELRDIGYPAGAAAEQIKPFWKA